MRIHESIEIESDELVGCCCNKCGKSIFLEGGFIEGGTATIRFGYGSTHDGDDYKLELCDDCVNEFVNTLKYKPEIEQYDVWCCIHCNCSKCA